MVDYLPSPLDIPAIKGVNPKTDEDTDRKADPKEPFSALAFKIMTDPYVGKLTYLRIYSGKLEAGSYALNSSKGNRERIGRILEMNANDRVDRDSCSAGDIVAVVGLKNTTTGDTLCDENAPGRSSSRWSSPSPSSTSPSSPRARTSRPSSRSAS